MFVVAVEFEIKPDCVGAFVPLMIENARASLDLEPGCRQFDVSRSDDHSAIFLYELYEDAEAFQDHLASSHFRAFDAAVSDMIVRKVVRTYRRIAS